MSPSVLRSVLLLAIFATAACASAPQPKAESRPEAEIHREQAEAAYQEGMKALDRHDWMTAVQRFEEVRTRYAYTKYAPLSELRIGDVLFEQGKYIEAADVYKSFARLRASHPDADYAAYRVGLSHARQAPSTFFLLPPDYEKDLTSTLEAVDAFENFLQNHPQSKHADEARRMLAEARRRLAEHELYVADFYRKREEWAGAAGRLEYLLSRFGGLGLEAQAKVRLADTYLHLEEPRVEDARRLVREVLEMEGVAPELAQEARQLQERIAARAPAAGQAEQAGSDPEDGSDDDASGDGLGAGRASAGNR